MIWLVIKASRGAIAPQDYEQKEYWTWRPAGEKPWIIRIFTKSRVWDDDRELKQDAGFPSHSAEGDGQSYR